MRGGGGRGTQWSRWNGGQWHQSVRGGDEQPSQSSQSQSQARDWRSSPQGKAWAARDLLRHRQEVLDRAIERLRGHKLTLEALQATIVTATAEVGKRESSVREQESLCATADEAAAADSAAAGEGDAQEFQDCKRDWTWDSSGDPTARVFQQLQAATGASIGSTAVQEAMRGLTAALAAADVTSATAPDLEKDICDMAVDDESRDALNDALALASLQPDGPTQKAARQAAISKFIPEAKRYRMFGQSDGLAAPWRLTRTSISEGRACQACSVGAAHSEECRARDDIVTCSDAM